MGYQLPYEIRELLQSELPSEKAARLASLIEKSIASVSEKANDLALQKKLEVKDELVKELASKGDLNAVKAELKADLRVYFVILLAAIIVLNRESITLIGQLLGLLK